ncbi:MAG: right-handed parallel beta-helix repeat-containing protein [Planctomycetota bacterium]|jgi:hypothetical protein
MHSVKQITSVQSIVLFILIACSAPAARAKSVYAIIYNLNDIIGAYKIDGNQIDYQTEIQAPQQGSIAIDLAIDSGSSCIFVTYEGSYIIEIMNAKTLEHEGSVTATGASDLAGIVFDEARQKLYTVDRGTNKLFVYFWDAADKTLTPEGINPKILADLTPSDAHGIALDANSNHLYVANRTNIVHYYDIDDWNDVNSVNVGQKAVDIDIDSDQGYLYAGGYTYHDYLLKLDLSTGITEANDIGAGVIGLAVDPNSGLVYTTTFHNQFRVYDTSTSPFTLTDYNDISKGCGVCVPTADVSYKPPAFYLQKIDVNEPNCVLPGDYITYKITYGPNGLDHNNVVITDYLPCQVDYINPFDPNYDDVNHTYKWQIGSLSASAPNDFVTLTVMVNFGVEPNGIITNYCEIESDHYYSFASAETNVCFWSPDIIYVDVNAVGCNSGLSWYHADPDLQNALQKAEAWDVNQIRVAEGTYKPTIGSDRSISFELLDGVAIYGGFPPGGGTWNQRNPDVYETIFSGDIAAPNDQSDNSYHVVKCENVYNAILDGFTITAGNADATGITDPNRFGGGICCKNSSVIKVANCTIIQNEGYYGGGIYNYNSSSLMITNCTFSDNSAFHGGTLYNDYSSSDVNITNCVFTGNTAKSYGGCIYNYQSSPALTNCAFSENHAVGYTFAGDTYGGFGGGIANYQSSPTLINCTFSGNSALVSSGNDGKGGAIYNTYYSSPAINNCVFSGNLSDDIGGGIYNESSNPNITNCIFSGNKANVDGGGIYNTSSSPNMTNCIFIGNTADSYGGGMHDHNCPLVAITNCIFNGNSADYYGGGIANSDDSNLALTNCTVSGNWAHYGGGICNWYYSDANLTNCIFWDNVAGTDGNEIYNDVETSDINVTYCDINEVWTGTGNIDEDPCFFEVEQSDGSWTENASYDNSTFQSTLTDDYANWAVNQLAGKFVNPNALNQYLQFFIVSNDVNTITVWSDVNDIAAEGDTYHIYDYHLRVDSACIDRGDPNGDYAGQKDIDGEPRLFDGDANGTEIVDMGADEYYWSPADFDTDGFVNFFDYALFADVWQLKPEDVNDYNDVYDLVDNDFIDINDLARFCEDWLWQTAWAKAFPFAYDEGIGRSMMGMGMGEGFFPFIEAKQARPQLTAADLEQMIKWLAELWLTDEEVRKMITEKEWLKFIESLKQVVKQLINN